MSTVRSGGARLLRDSRARLALGSSCIALVTSAFVTAVFLLHATRTDDRDLKEIGAFAFGGAAILAIGASALLSRRAKPPRPPDAEIDRLPADLIRERAAATDEYVEDTLRETALRLELAQQAGRVGVFDWDLTTDQQYWSSGMAALFGLEESEARARPEEWQRHVHPDDLPRIQALRAEWLLSSRDEEYWEYRYLRPDQERWVAVRARLFRDSEGKPVRMIGTSLDITERKQAEDGVREADRRKTDFLAMLSHELRNPLAPIRNSLYILEHAATGGEQAQRAHHIIDRQVTHLTRIVDDLLDVTRIERGKIRLQRERLDLCGLLRSTAEDHRSVLTKNGVALELHLPETPLYIQGDATRIAQIVGNLLQNSSKFTPRGGQTTVTLEQGESGQVRVRVRDNGVGMPPEMISRLFEPFVQADRSLERSRGGLGLGLALVKGLVELHGGTVTAQSAGLGKGTEFIVSLPLDAPEEEGPSPEWSAPPSVCRRVLVIEDNEDAAESLKEALELLGHQVATAATGVEGVEKAASFHPDVVLCDIGLPGIDGYEVARRVRADPRLSALRLIALSGYALPEDVERARAAGFDEHVAKPPSLDRLEERLSGVPTRAPEDRVLH